jgi:L-cystine uptake protein TcyP (sodium:dicarboxylate symporter family)
LQYFWVRTFHFRWNLQHVVARTVHVTWLFATRVHLGLVLGLVYGFCLVLSF